MAFMVKHVVGGQLKNLTGGLTEDKSDGDKSDAAAKGMTQEEFEQYQQQLEEENGRARRTRFAQKKGGEATVRLSHLETNTGCQRVKFDTHVIDFSPFPWFSVSQNELDETQIQAAADDVELPTELAKMIAEDNQEEEQKQSVLGHLTNIQNVDMGHLKDKAQATLEDLKSSAEKCCVM
ncbi:hypothetical protein cypCar_00040098 [Cyprinus carpio]|nr:hypothetical protein cypCar_00040098 [Cyprinus carpio]